MRRIHTHQYPSGLTLLVEPIDAVASAGLTLLLPAGAATESVDRQGIGAVLSEMLFRGAGELNARQHSDALDRLGVHRSAEVQSQHMRIGALLLGDRLHEVLPLIVDMVRRPHLAEQTFEPSVQLAIQSIEGLEDEPQDKVMIELNRRHLGEPLGRSTLGNIEHLKAMSVADVHNFARRRFMPGGSILALAGHIDPQRATDLVGELFEGFTGDATCDYSAAAAAPSHHHIASETTQQHIGLAYETVGERDASNMTQRLAAAVLSGGMSGRLFTEVREKRGLCYSVYARYAARRDSGTVYAYAGTTTQRAAETLEVLSSELRRIGDGVERVEFERAVVGLKSKLVMSGESTSARARAIACDQYILGRPRTLEERAAQVDAVTFDELNDFVAAHRPTEFTTLTIGPEPLVKADAS